jgi:hypothetical protein
VDAPNYNGAYPGAGKMVGPAWVKAWSMMEDGDWHLRTALVPAMVEASGAQPKTCEQILWEARTRGVLQGKGRRTGKRYRIAPSVLNGHTKD